MVNGNITRVPLNQLIRAVDQTRKYTFLIGAGTSRPKPAEIPTGQELTKIFREECFNYENPNQGFEEWVEAKEESIAANESEYGFWFEQRHPTQRARRKRIHDIVKDAPPTLGHLILAEMMSKEYVPHTLTPNFDDLIYDSFFHYMDTRPHVVNHEAVTPEFEILDRPMIVKLHGDYLYGNLQNTNSETESLSNGMNKILGSTIKNNGLFVVGYGGSDESIMEPLLDSLMSEYGVFWCKRNPNNLSGRTEELLQRDKTYLVKIEGFIPLMIEFYRQIDDIELPDREDLVGRAEERADQIQETLITYSETDESEQAYAEKLERIIDAHEALSAGDYERAIDLWGEVIDIDPQEATAYYNRGLAKMKLREYEAAIEDYDRAIDLKPGFIYPYLGRAEALIETGNYQQARNNAREVDSISSSSDEVAKSLLLQLISTSLLGEGTDDIEAKYQTVCKQDFTIDWNFDELDSWLETVDPDEREQIEEWIDMLREHKPD